MKHIRCMIVVLCVPTAVHGYTKRCYLSPFGKTTEFTQSMKNRVGRYDSHNDVRVCLFSDDKRMCEIMLHKHDKALLHKVLAHYQDAMMIEDDLIRALLKRKRSSYQHVGMFLKDYREVHPQATVGDIRAFLTK